MQLLDPLAIEHIGFAPGHVLQMAGIHQKGFQAAGLQDFKNRNPVDARGFHRHRVHATGDEPIRQGVEIRGEGAKHPYILYRLGRGDTNPNLACANIQSSGIRVNDRQFVQTLDFLGGAGFAGHSLFSLSNTHEGMSALPTPFRHRA